MPSTNVKVYSGIPLDDSYENTVYFGSASSQINAFEPYKKYEFTQQSYQRTNSKTIRLARPKHELDSCNYLSFQNTGYSNKWYFAFIDSVEYVNEVTSEVSFTIDLMQTRMFDYELEECFVEREHSATDEVGDNTIPENLELGPIESGREIGTNLCQADIIVIAAPYLYTSLLPAGHEWVRAPGAFVGGMYSGLAFTVVKSTSPEAVEALNTALLESDKDNVNDKIVAIFGASSNFFEAHEREPKTMFFTFTKDMSTIGDGVYKPRNKKLLTYPYNYIHITNLSGEFLDLQYELFGKTSLNTGEFTFKLIGDSSCTPSVRIMPVMYNGNSAESKDEYLTINNYPQYSWNSDTYKSWVARNAASLATSIAVPVSDAMSRTYLSEKAAVPLVGNIANTLARMADKHVGANKARGATNGNLQSANRMLDFYFTKCSIRKEYAQIIDDYFDAYGYATHRVKVPNRNVRPHWTYTKTIGCNIKARFPASEAKKIREIYDNGITFWKNLGEVGNYSLNNQV